VEKLKLAAAVIATTVVVSLLGALVIVVLPETLFLAERSKFLVGLFGSLILASIAGFVAYHFNRFVERPMIRIEHVNIKSEREPFSMPDDVWWFVIHQKDLMEAIDKSTPWSMSCFDKNEFRYYHLQSIRENAEIFRKRYESTAAWTQKLLGLIESYLNESDDSRREVLIEEMHPFVSRFEDHYHDSFKSGLYHDLKENRAKAISYLGAEIKGLLAAHRKEIESFRSVEDWAVRNLSGGESVPRPIDYHKKLVPSPSILIGLSNVGRTTGLLRFRARVKMKEVEIPIKFEGKSFNHFVELPPNKALPIVFSVDTNVCGFEIQEQFYKSLVAEKYEKVTICLELADGSVVTKKGVKLFDDKNVWL
jgi:hypothetical protein